MRVFLTGATGFIGSRIIPELLSAGHRVVGMTRSQSGARALETAGVEVHRGTLEDLGSMRAGAHTADAVIHTAFDHELTNFAANCEKDRRVIYALGDVLKGSDRPFIITSGTGIGDAGPGRPALESIFNPDHPNPRIASEKAGHVLLQAGVDVRVMRLPQVHDTMKQGLISPFIAISRENGVVAYVGDGANRWPAAHVRDVAKLYALILDRGVKGARYHAVAEEGVTARAIADVVARGMNLPMASLTAADALEKLGWFAMFAGLDMPASSAWTREQLGWMLEGPDLIADLEAMDYAPAAVAA